MSKPDMDERLRALPREEPRAGFAERVAAAATRAPPSRRPPFFGIALVTGALVTVWAAFILFDNTKGIPTEGGQAPKSALTTEEIARLESEARKFRAALSRFEQDISTLSDLRKDATPTERRTLFKSVLKSRIFADRDTQFLPASSTGEPL